MTPVSIPADASGAGRAVETRTALLPLSMNGQRMPLRSGPPSLGQDTTSLMQALGYTREEINDLMQHEIRVSQMSHLSSIPMYKITSRWPHQGSIKIEWNLGKRCNFDCSYCPSEIHDNTSPHTDIEILKKTDILYVHYIRV